MNSLCSHAGKPRGLHKRQMVLLEEAERQRAVDTELEQAPIEGHCQDRGAARVS